MEKELESFERTPLGMNTPLTETSLGRELVDAQKDERFALFFSAKEGCVMSGKLDFSKVTLAAFTKCRLVRVPRPCPAAKRPRIDHRRFAAHCATSACRQWTSTSLNKFKNEEILRGEVLEKASLQEPKKKALTVEAELCLKWIQKLDPAKVRWAHS
jgi:hypothetical protein